MNTGRTLTTPLRWPTAIWYLIVIIERLHQSASCSRLFFDKFCWALSTKFDNFNQGTLVLFYSLLSCCVGAKTTWFNMFYCSVFNRNWRHDWEQVPSCLQSHKLHDTTTSYAVPHVIGPCSCTSAAITTVLPICMKTTNPLITEKAKSPYILQA